MNKVIAVKEISLAEMTFRNKIDILNMEIVKTESFEKSIVKFQWMTGSNERN